MFKVGNGNIYVVNTKKILKLGPDIISGVRAEVLKCILFTALSLQFILVSYIGFGVDAELNKALLVASVGYLDAMNVFVYVVLFSMLLTYSAIILFFINDVYYKAPLSLFRVRRPWLSGASTAVRLSLIITLFALIFFGELLPISVQLLGLFAVLVMSELAWIAIGLSIRGMYLRRGVMEELKRNASNDVGEYFPEVVSHVGINKGNGR
jgi:hypothetical protein